MNKAYCTGVSLTGEQFSHVEQIQRTLMTSSRTTLGATYAALFPEKVHRMVLDGGDILDLICIQILTRSLKLSGLQSIILPYWSMG